MGGTLSRYESRFAVLASGIQQITQQLNNFFLLLHRLNLLLPNTEGLYHHLFQSLIFLQPNISELSSHNVQSSSPRNVLIFSGENAKFAYIISLMSGQACMLGTAEWEHRSEACSSFELLSKDLKTIPDRGVPTSPFPETR